MPVEDLIVLGSIVGDGGHAAEMVEIIERVNAIQPRWNLLGYILAENAKQQTNGYPILGGPEAIERYPQARFVAMNGRAPAQRIARERFVSLVDPSTFVSRTASLGASVVLFPNGYVGLNARLGDHCFALANVVINHDVVLEDRVVVAAGAMIAGTVRVGDGTYLGQSCTIREKITIGRNCLIGAGAVVVKDVPDNSVMVGNPARYLRARQG